MIEPASARVFGPRAGLPAMSPPPRSESDLSRLRRLARECAKTRSESPTTLHLLTAVWQGGGPARALLDARRLDESRLMQAARAFDERDDGALQHALDEARRIAHQAAVPSRAALPARRGSRPMAAAEPSGIHVLVAILSDRLCAAYRALVQCGVDIAGLRAAATRVALGVVAPPRQRREREVERESRMPPEPRRRRPRTPKSEPPASTRRSRRRTGRAIQVPLIPPPRKAMATKPGVGTPTPKPSSPKSSPAPKTTPPPAPETPSRRGRQVEAAPSPPPARVEAKAPVGSSGLDPDQFPTLATLRNLTAAAALGELEPAVARSREVEQALDVLAKRHANSPVLVGRAGVGKTTVAYGIAATLAEEPLERARLLLELPVSELLAGTSARGSLAERLAALRDEVKRMQGRVVLFVDELHELLDGGIEEAVSELKSALASGELPLLGAMSVEEYRRTVEADPGLARRFSPVEVAEPGEGDALLMLRSASRQLGAHHGITYGDAALEAAVSWSVRYLPGRALPDKALGVLDLAGARLRRRRDGARELLPAQVAEVMSELVDVPVERLLASDQQRMVALAELLGERVVGHEEPCERIAAVLRRNAAGLRGRRPLGSFLLLGPTGVGKTETAKAISEILFHAPDAMTRLDMSEYAEPHALARLVGAPPGYVGHESGGLLTEAVRRRPYQVLLLDEIEKAHQDVLQCFLQVFDEGRLTDGRGRTVDFTNCVVVLTSNLGARELGAAMTTRRVGFGRSDEGPPDRGRMQDVAIAAARAQLPPELYNRIDEVLFFRHLERADVREVARRLLAGLAESLAAKDISLDVDDAALDALLDQGGYDPELGARPMRRAIVRLVEAPLADMILRGELKKGGVALLSAEDGEVIVDAVDGVNRVA